MKIFPTGVVAIGMLALTLTGPRAADLSQSQTSAPLVVRVSSAPNAPVIRVEPQETYVVNGTNAFTFKVIVPPPASNVQVSPIASPLTSTPLVVCVTNAPVIRSQPQDQYAQNGTNMVQFTVAAEGTPPDLGSDFYYQWQINRYPGLSNYVDIAATNNPSAASNIFTIFNANTNDVAYYRVVVYGNGSTVSEPAMLLIWTTNSPLTVYGTPVHSVGTSPYNCPGPYLGYVSYPQPPYQFWGYAPIESSEYSASDGGTLPQDNRITFIGSSGHSGCWKVKVFVGTNPATGTRNARYRFTLYFVNPGATSWPPSYPITLVGFQ